MSISKIDPNLSFNIKNFGHKPHKFRSTFGGPEHHNPTPNKNVSGLYKYSGRYSYLDNKNNTKSTQLPRQFTIIHLKHYKLLSNTMQNPSVLSMTFSPTNKPNKTQQVQCKSPINQGQKRKSNIYYTHFITQHLVLLRIQAKIYLCYAKLVSIKLGRVNDGEKNINPTKKNKRKNRSEWKRKNREEKYKPNKKKKKKHRSERKSKKQR
ncbi:hypothetical protein BGW37DRAFT_474582 [Umbelopsis sp. PMI_123]|nr:hypothetical protein BGW37DRAFT_474582 [Umbelopsis sp. PMI_123]